MGVYGGPGWGPDRDEMRQRRAGPRDVVPSLPVLHLSSTVALGACQANLLTSGYTGLFAPMLVPLDDVDVLRCDRFKIEQVRVVPPSCGPSSRAGT